MTSWNDLRCIWFSLCNTKCSVSALNYLENCCESNSTANLILFPLILESMSFEFLDSRWSYLWIESWYLLLFFWLPNYSFVTLTCYCINLLLTVSCISQHNSKTLFYKNIFQIFNIFSWSSKSDFNLVVHKAGTVVKIKWTSYLIFPCSRKEKVIKGRKGGTVNFCLNSPLFCTCSCSECRCNRHCHSNWTDRFTT